MHRILTTVFFLIFVLGNISAQKTTLNSTSLRHFHRGVDYFDKEKYGAAQNQFEKAMSTAEDANSEVQVNARYFAALCGMQLFNRDADLLLREFIRNHPQSPKVKEAIFQLGIYNYRKRKWDKANDWFAQVDKLELSPNEQAEYFFKYGYSLFQKKEIEEAKKKFYEIKDTDNKYVAPARYYYGHIEFNKGNYQTAFEDLKKLEEHKQFGPIVPYYIAQILYAQKRNDALVEYVKPKLDSEKIKRRSEMARLVGDAYYTEAKYTEAIKYLEMARKPPSKLDREGEYQLAYSQFRSGDYYGSIKSFAKLSGNRDALGQMSLYQMASAYLKVGEKKYARNAFKSAADLDFDSEIAEDALFNYAKLSYEVSFDPYNKAVKAFKAYIDQYPNSPRVEEAYEYILKVYLTSKNYELALQSIEQITNKSEDMKKAYQLICYNRATELFQNRDFKKSIAYYDRSLTYPLDKNLIALAHYWKGEAYYRLSNYVKSIEAYKQFIFQPTAILQQEFNEANYNLGYAYFKLQDYENAQSWFRKFFYYKNENDTARLTDSYMRTGDCFFVAKSFADAIPYYQSAYDLGAFDQDYALYQLGLCQGLTRNLEEKIDILAKLIANHPKSSYQDAAKYEMGASFLKKNEEDKALQYFESVINGYPNSVYVKRSLISKGLILYNRSDLDNALTVFQQVVKDFPTYEDSREALLNIKNIYIEQGKVDDYTTYIDQLDFVDLDEAALDTAVYNAAELKYLEGKFDQARTDLEAYLSRFNPALFELNATYYVSDCYLRGGNKVKALEGFMRIVPRATNKFTEPSLLYAARIQYEAKDYEAALANYNMLEKVAAKRENVSESIIGQMRCLNRLDNRAGASEYALRVLELEKLDLDLYTEARSLQAQAARLSGAIDSAFVIYRELADTTTSEIGASAMYEIASILMERDSFEAAETAVFDLVNLVPSYPYWTAKGLLLLADIYLANDDLFQAKATLQSIIDNYEGDDEILEQAKSNLKKIEDIENAMSQIEEEELEIDFGEGEENYDELFEEEEEEEEDFE
jgi:TolA-binding protein